MALQPPPVETSFCGIPVPGRPMLPFSSEAAYSFVPEMAVCIEAVDLFMQHSVIVPIERAEGFALLHYLHPFVIPAGEVFMHEGGLGHNDHCLFIVRGHVLLESVLGEEGGSVPIGVLGPGSWVGEIAQKDDTVMRQTSCRVVDAQDLLCAVLTRKQLLLLMSERPALAAKLALLMSYNASRILRELNQKMVAFIHINNMHQLQQALDFAQNAQKMLHTNAQTATAAVTNGAKRAPSAAVTASAVGALADLTADHELTAALTTVACTEASDEPDEPHHAPNTAANSATPDTTFGQRMQVA